MDVELFGTIVVSVIGVLYNSLATVAQGVGLKGNRIMDWRA